MKRVGLIISFITLSASVFAQIQNPVKWFFSSKQISAGKYEIHLTATVDMGWHIYSQTTPDGGPVPTAIVFTKNPLLTLGGAVKEVGKLEQHNEPLFGVDVKQFSNKVDFVQILTLKANVKTNATGTIEFMVCNDKQCLPPKTITFNIAL